MTLRRFPFAFVLVLVTASLGCGTTIVEGADSNNDGGTGDAGTADDTGAEAADSNDTSCSIGSDGCPCTDGGACDHGLTCQAGLCTDACQIGLEGCPCTQGGACDPGLMCEAGACVPASAGDGDGDSGDGDGDTGDGDGEPNFDEACYLGPLEDNSVCFPIVSPAPLPSDYDYPAPYQGNVNYRAPVRYLDLQTIDNTAAVAPNFTLDELAQLFKGRYAVVQPHAVVRLQNLRDQLGPISVNSGYRSPTYNLSIGGATSSRHIYGDGFDLDPVDATLTQLEAACTQNAGFLVEYESHVHCDWRGIPVDVGFFGLPNVFDPDPDYPVLAAELRRDPVSGDWTAPATGFDEGEPLRRWSAFDANDRVILEARGRSFAAPAETVRVEVVVGAQIQLRSN
jgi:hypothetical protein